MHIKSTLVFSTLAFACCAAQAEDWTVSAGLQNRDVKISRSTGKYHDEAWSANTSLMKKVDAFTYVGGSLSYRNDNAESSGALKTSVDSSAVFGMAFLMRDLGQGRLLNASLGYGNINLDSNSAFLSYGANSNVLTAGLGLFQTLPLSPNLSAVLGAQYTYIHSDNDSYRTSAGTDIAGIKGDSGLLALSGKLSWRIDKWVPTVSLAWNRSDKAFLPQSTDKDYFSYGIGIGYQVDPNLRVALNYGSVAAKQDVKENTVGLNATLRF